MVKVVAAGDAKTNLYELCRGVRAEGKLVCVKDKSAQRFMTICPSKKTIEGAIVDVPITRFKSDFSRFSNLVKMGLSYRILMKSGEVFARRHSSYIDPLQDIVDRWQTWVADSAIEKAEASAVRRDLATIATGQETSAEALREVIRGVARLAIGHRPFAEGQLDG